LFIPTIDYQLRYSWRRTIQRFVPCFKHIVLHAAPMGLEPSNSYFFAYLHFAPTGLKTDYVVATDISPLRGVKN